MMMVLGNSVGTTTPLCRENSCRSAAEGEYRQRERYRRDNKHDQADTAKRIHEVVLEENTGRSKSESRSG